MITLPDCVDVDAIAEDAMQTAFKLICDRIDAAVGGHTWGDVDPLESHRIDQEFRGWVRMMAENNTAIQADVHGVRMNAPLARRLEDDQPWHRQTPSDPRSESDEPNGVGNEA